VLTGIVKNMPSQEIEYDYMAGVSIGAINASILATYPVGELLDGINSLRNLYETYTTAELFEFYDPWFVAPFTHTSFADNTKLLNIVKDKLADRPFVRNLSVLAADLING
jgi:predicted acylesterase/phospholipase RssA